MDYLYSSQLLIAMSSMLIVQKALINELAKRALVISGIFKSIAARLILYPLSSYPAVRFFGTLTTMSSSFSCSISRACGFPDSLGQ